MKRIGIVILSRFSSSRLPGKALMKIKSKPMLQYIIERLLRVVDLQQVVLATSDQVSDDPIVEFSKQAGLACFRGSLENVADRFYQAAKSQNWDYAVRINGDNIFVDLNVLQEMIQIAVKGEYDFVSNVKGRTFPKGMSVEIINLEYYKSLLQSINSDAGYREHVTLYLYEHEQRKHFYVFNTSLPEASGIQMALDTKEDLLRTQTIMDCFTKPHWEYNLKEIYTIWKSLNYETI